MKKTNLENTSEKLQALSRIFCRKMMRTFIEGKDLDLYKKIVQNYCVVNRDTTNDSVIRFLYKRLKEQYQNEYLYKNILFLERVGKTRNFVNNGALTETTVGNSKVDFIILNSHAEAFEIKTPLDNLDRLKTQIMDYYKAFSYVTIFTAEEKLEKVERIVYSIKRPIGILVLSKEFKVEICKEPEAYYNDLDKELIFKLLRKKEVEAVLEENGKNLPNVSQFEYYRACLKTFSELSLQKSYPCVIEKLKKRNKAIAKDLIKIPEELSVLGYFMNLKKSEYSQLLSFLRRPF